MDLKNRTSSRKKLINTSSSKSFQKNKTSNSRNTSNDKQKRNKFVIEEKINIKKKMENQTLLRKKMEGLKTPQLIIKLNYKGKRLSIPIHQLDQKNLNETVLPHVCRFEKQILRNDDFKENTIQNWKISGNDILKDYYFQTGKTLNVFRGQILEIQPIWKKKQSHQIGLKDLQIIKCIGTGGFSRVFLVRMKETGKFYALKLMQKEGLLQSGKQCIVTNQRDIMINLDNPHVLKLQFTFETKHFVAFGLEYCPGGQLFYYLRKIRRMTEDQARYCFVQILLGIQYLHSKKIIYRDIKPENIMIDANGNLKIVDFGLSKIGMKPNQLAFTYCGSPEYMAPQMLSKSGHNYSVDYYCLGALLYELVTGNPPFYSRNVQKIYYSIQNQDIDFPSHVDLSPQIKMLLEGLLVKDPNRRLGCLGGIRQILGHPWVRKIKVSDVKQRLIETPIKIDLLTFNINEEEVKENNSDFQGKFDDEDSNFQPMFIDFYYQRNQPFNLLQEMKVQYESTKQNKNLNKEYKNQKSQLKILRTKDNFATKNQSKRNTQVIKLKKKKNQKQLNLVERGRKREDKQKSIKKHSKRLGSPKTCVSSNTLKRVKSSTALLGQHHSVKNHRN